MIRSNHLSFPHRRSYGSCYIRKLGRASPGFAVFSRAIPMGLGVHWFYVFLL